MAEGNPRLAVWETAGTVRTFEYSGGAFVQLASLGGFPMGNLAHPAGITLFPELAWARDGAFVTLRYAANSIISRLWSWNEFLDPKGFADGSNTVSGASRGISSYNHADEVSVFHCDGTQSTNQIFVPATGIPTTPGTTSPASAGTTERCFEITPDGEYALSGRIKPSDSLIYTKTGMSGAGVAYSAGVPFTSKGINCAGWSPDSKYLITGDAVLNTCQVFEMVADVPTLIMELPPEDGAPVCVAFSPDRRWVAIGYLNGGDYFTVAYRRTGPYFVKKQTLTAMGQLLDYSANGKLLVDAAQRKAYSFDGNTLTLVSGAMASVPAGQTVQAMSQHAVDPVGLGSLYNNAIDSIISGTVGLDTLKLTLLTSAASFLETHTTLDQVTNSGAYEVSTSGWPAGGLLMTGVDKENTGPTVNYKADNLYRVIITETLTARYAVVYDDGSVDQTPIAFLDFQAEKTIVKNTELVLSFRSGNFITFGN